MWIWMLLSLLGVLYLASASLLGYVVYQDRANAAHGHARQRTASRDPSSSASPEMVFSTRA